MEIECLFCKDHFSTKGSLTRHLKDKRCKGSLLDDWVSLHEFIEKKIQKLDLRPEPKSPVTINSLNLSYITPDRIQPFLEKYDIDLLEEYISYIIYNKEHPENYVVKYNTRYPPTFYCESSILVLEATAEELVKPIIDIIERHKKKCLKVYKDDEEFMSDYKERKTFYDNNSLLKDVSKCLKRILKKILYDPEMKC
jgi:hypothetical protein